MAASTILKWITGVLEAFLGIPIFGGLFIISHLWAPLALMLVLHIITCIFSIMDRKNFHGSILGILTSFLGFIPFIGMMMHIITSLVLLIDAYYYTKRNK